MADVTYAASTFGELQYAIDRANAAANDGGTTSIEIDSTGAITALGALAPVVVAVWTGRAFRSALVAQGATRWRNALR